MKRIVILICLFFILSPYPIFAQSTYVLPYPSSMPGSIYYKLNLLQEKLEAVWYFGNFGQFTYNLKYADRYLVEAKTLFEYKQYLLADKALSKSNMYFQQTSISLANAEGERKDTSEKQALLQQAALKHSEILEKLKQELPESFDWQPEKEEGIRLNLYNNVEKAIDIREKVL